eukprot:317791-Chlamydomonas_euryale.AAC.1
MGTEAVGPTIPPSHTILTSHYPTISHHPNIPPSHTIPHHPTLPTGALPLGHLPASPPRAPLPYLGPRALKHPTLTPTTRAHQCDLWVLLKVSDLLRRVERHEGHRAGRAASGAWAWKEHGLLRHASAATGWAS